MSRFLGSVLMILLFPPLAIAADDEPHPGAEAFIAEVVKEHGLEADEVRALLREAQYQQVIIDAITRPAEARPWHEYRQIFMTETRIAGGAEFWRANAELLAEVEQRFEVPAAMVVAIVGVETNYGMITGRYRVIDALATLGFYYPRRADFFARELGHYLVLAREEELPLTEVRGSYAGAMGIGQFIPSSYRAYAVDFDGNGRRDLWRSLPDALGSVANYFRAHRWAPGDPVARPATVGDNPPEPSALRLDTTVGALLEAGVEFEHADLDTNTAAMLVQLEGAHGPEYWVGLNNFYVITRYNRSPLYALAVYQLSEAIRERMQ